MKFKLSLRAYDKELLVPDTVVVFDQDDIKPNTDWKRLIVRMIDDYTSRL